MAHALKRALPLIRLDYSVQLASSRSSITNLKRLHVGVNGRTAGARRFRDLITALSAEFGGFEAMGEADRALVRQAATLTMEAERMQAASVRGERVDHDTLIRLTSTLRRVVDRLASIKPKVQPANSAREFFERRKAAAG